MHVIELWCLQLVNVQSNAQFASHQLNRDVWSHNTVRDIVKSAFIFWQVTSCRPGGLLTSTSAKADWQASLL